MIFVLIPSRLTNRAADPALLVSKYVFSLSDGAGGNSIHSLSRHPSIRTISSSVTHRK